MRSSRRVVQISFLCALAVASSCAEPITEPAAPAAPSAETTSQPSKAEPPVASQATVIDHVDAAGAAKLISEQADLAILDVRTPTEFAAGHLEGAVNVDFRGDAFRQGLAALDRQKPTLVHCRSGGRSTSALEVLRELGFAHVYHLDGGMLGWEKAEQPVVKD